MGRLLVITAALAVSMLTATTGESRAAVFGGKADISSPLRSGNRAGCRWVQVPARSSRLCDAKGQSCRTQTVPAQRVWACGQVRD